MPISQPIPRLMAFVDGENLVGRFQEMVANGNPPLESVRHVRDEFVWHSGLQELGFIEVIRAHYYMSAVGDDDHIRAVADRIRREPFASNAMGTPQTMLFPRVFKKPAKSKKTTTVDINLTVDMLSHAYQRNAESFVLFSGDGDFAPLVREVAARGLRVYVAAFSSGLSRELVACADRILNLDHVYFGRGTA